MREINTRKTSAEKIAELQHETFTKKCPEAYQIEKKLRTTGIIAAKTVLKGGNVKKELEKLREGNLFLQKQLEELMVKNACSKQDLEPNYSCKKCNDTGYVGGFMCDCLKEVLKRISFEELNASTPLEISGFEQYNIKYFENFTPDNKDSMLKNFFFCRQYADNFSMKSPSLLFYGATGLGKTHLSLAIAKVAIERGYSVVYGSIQSFASKIEKERFSDEAETSNSLMDCELLLIDDLGVEFSSNYTQSVIYDVINTRIMRNLPTIISTNLNPAELQKRYGERMISRFFGSYKRLQFVGKDIRKMKSEV